MRFMLMVKSTPNTEAGVQPSNELLAEMGAFNEQLVRSGILLAGEGLQPSAKGARVRMNKGGKRTVVDGPFAETKELIGGFWIVNVKSRQDAIDLALRCPHPNPGEDAEIEIRQVFEPEDFTHASPELIQKERELRKLAEK
ncbi:MAG TPA: YciI family protein [Myxococcota bacterium]|nr:YciI family protein [Myxococcota bacterium]